MGSSYTINYFIDLITSTSTSKIKADDDSLYTTISPRHGYGSVKAYTLDAYLDHKTSSILKGEGQFATYGKTPRSRLLKALRLRKQNGSV